MALFDRQCLAALSVTQGALVTALEYEVGPAFKSKVEAAIEVSNHALENWPVVSDTGALDSVERWAESWSDHQPEIDELTISELLTLAIAVVTDLDDRVSTKCRKTRKQIHCEQLELLQPIFTALQDALEYVSPSGGEFATCDKVTILTTKLYQIMEI